jgi:hypothetical protein
MKNTIKLAAIGAAALAVSSTSALALSELPAGVTTGLALGAPLPEGVYDISVASYGSRNNGLVTDNFAYALPVWLIWSTPWQIAGGRIALDTVTGVASISANNGNSYDSWLNTLLEGSVAWSLGNGWNASVRAGAWLPSEQALSKTLGRDYVAFQGGGSVSYVANGWNLTATGIYGSAGARDHVSYNPVFGTSIDNWQPSWFNLDLTATKKLGKMEVGVIAYGSWDLEYRNGCNGCKKESQFAVGGLVGYDFGSFIAQAKLAGDVMAENHLGLAAGYDQKEVRGTLTIIKPLWSPAAEGPLK